MPASLLLPSLALSLSVAAAPLTLCRPWRQQREALSSQAMTAELQLVHQTRLRLCPDLERQAAAANANDQVYEPIDYQALLNCRHEAERRLRRQRPVLYRNRQGFLFYTEAGAGLSRQADALQRRSRDQGCP